MDHSEQQDASELASGGNSAPVLNRHNAHDLQQLIGNQAVARLPVDGTPPRFPITDEPHTLPDEQGTEGRAERPEQQQVEAEEAQEPEQEREINGLTENEIDVILGRTEAFGPNVPSFEVVSATTAAQLSTGELEQEVGRLWRRDESSFTGAARQAAETDSSRRRGSAIPTQSANLAADQPYAKRWLLGLYAHDYETWSDLPDIKMLLKKGSSFQRSAEADFDEVFSVENPSGLQIHGEVRTKARHLRRGLERDEIGELVVFFSGHGGRGSISGVDGKSVEPSELASLANLAQDFGIHTVYVLDTCRAGTLASLAHLAAQDDIDESIADAGLGDDTGLAERSQMMRTMATESLAAKEAAADVLDWYREHRRLRRKRKPAAEIAEAERERSAAANRLGDHVGRIYALLHRAEDDAVPHRASLIRSNGALMLGSVYLLERRRTRSYLNEIAPFFDTMNDSLNAQLVALRQAVVAAQNGPQ